ncbi:MAG: response regulator [Anaerolineaceae bacterium]|jgi:CheY-like chemotaxis protein|nr:response regulator [Anaerolineaceae bacterium]
MEKPLVLIIEDDPAQNQIFNISLRNDFVVETFLEGGSAAARLEEVIPALVLLDLNLPGKSGRELLVQIRGDKRLAATRIILTTADEQQADMIEKDADLVLLKPISPGQLKELALRMVQKLSGEE